ncbi:hypothetical protein L1987_70956 [Smallanthus sonchifolius]|uniref:Uncharacterized protein n=1 Tax=Smallanthus sonchifolius TaxID=185202 RepID=A0ACB9AR37_9ASTR|nr:hypothetical protein L1987_70956 [Smallanthus sonchifolius]
MNMGWKQVPSGAKVVSQEDHLFRMELKGGQVENGGTDFGSLQEGYITITPLGALTNADIDSRTFFNEWLHGVAEIVCDMLSVDVVE